MTWVVGIIVAALLFALFAAIRPVDRSCRGGCIGCARLGACRSSGDLARDDLARDDLALDDEEARGT